MVISFSNFPQDMTEEEIEKMFSEFGPVQKLHLKRDKLTKKSLGYGSLEMDSELGKAAIAALNNKEWKEKKLSVGDIEELRTKLLPEHRSHSALQNPFSGKVYGRSSNPSHGSSNIQRRGGTRGS